MGYFNRPLIPALPARKARDPSYAQRLTDKIMAAFQHACDESNTEIAAHLLDVLEYILSRPPYLPAGWERRAKENLVAAHERLWALRHPQHAAEH